MKIDYSKIAILSTVINFDLYKKSSQLFPENIQKYVIDGRNGMHSLNSIFYMVRKLKNKNIDWLIMADEDVLFKDTAIIFDIISKMKTENYTVWGVRDGGVILHRESNPYVVNTFFSIVNFSERQTNRIDKIFELLKFDNNKISSPIIYKDNLFLETKNKKIYHKILELLKI